MLCKQCKIYQNSLKTKEPGACAYRNWEVVDGECRGFESVEEWQEEFEKRWTDILEAKERYTPKYLDRG